MRVCKSGEMATVLPATHLPPDVNRRLRFFRKEKKPYMPLSALTCEAIIEYLDNHAARLPAVDERLPV